MNLALHLARTDSGFRNNVRFLIPTCQGAVAEDINELGQDGSSLLRNSQCGNRNAERQTSSRKPRITWQRRRVYTIFLSVQGQPVDFLRRSLFKWRPGLACANVGLRFCGRAGLICRPLRNTGFMYLYHQRQHSYVQNQESPLSVVRPTYRLPQLTRFRRRNKSNFQFVSVLASHQEPKEECTPTPLPRGK